MKELKNDNTINRTSQGGYSEYYSSTFAYVTDTHTHTYTQTHIHTHRACVQAAVFSSVLVV